MILDSKSLSAVLQRGGNNFDVLRLVAAVMVIVGHAYAIAPQPPLQDPVLKLLNFDFSGSLAVKFFFFLSGLLVTQSLIRRPEPLQFLARRALRIFPGLLICLVISVFIIGPIFTKFPIYDYFAQSDTWTYLARNSLLVDLQWRLPGVFSDHKYGLNGSLWTLPFESICYLYIAIFCGLGLFSFRFAANAVFSAIVAMAFLAPHYLPRFGQNPLSFLLPACFALGALFAINKQSIKIDLQRVILLWIFASLVNEPKTHLFLFYVAFFYTSIFVASLDFVIKRLKPPFDASYGVYVYGFMIQQCVNSVVPNVGVYGNQLISIMLALVVGIASWYIVEKHAIAFGEKITFRNWIALMTLDKFHRVRDYFSLNYGMARLRRTPFALRLLVIGLGVLMGIALTVLHFSRGNASYALKQNDSIQDSAALELQVVNWGPQSTKVGTIPNRQSDGSMGLWIEVAGIHRLGEAQVIFGGNPAMGTVVQENIITAAISTVQLSYVGNKEVFIRQISTGKSCLVGTFLVEPVIGVTLGQE